VSGAPTETIRHSPLREVHLEADAKLVEFAGWEMPISYDGIREEHLTVRSHAGIFDVSHMGQVEVEGPGAEAYLQRVLSNDIGVIAVGGAQYSLLCDEHGGILDDLFTYRLSPDNFLIVTNAANHGTDLKAMARWVHEFDCVLRDVADRWAMIAVQGPNARALTGSALGIALPKRMQTLATAIGGAPGLACGTGYTGEDGVELLVDPGRAPDIWRALCDAGAVPCGLGARDSLRLEACFHLHGNDISPETNPIEAGLGWACKEATGFVGATAVAEIRAAGPRRKLAPFKIEGKGIARPGNPVIQGGETVGEVTSGGHSPSLGIGVGLAYLPPELAEPGQEIEIDVRGRTRRARTATKPLYRKD